MTETVEVAGRWDIYCRIARYLPDEDSVSCAERAPRRAAPEGRGCVYVVPAAEGTVVCWLDQNDYRQEHITWQVRRGGEWIFVPADEACDALAPGGAARWKAEREHRAAMALKYALTRYAQPRGAWKYEDGVYRLPDGRIVSVDRANSRFYYARVATPKETADYEAIEKVWAAEDAAAAEAAPAA